MPQFVELPFYGNLLSHPFLRDHWRHHSTASFHEHFHGQDHLRTIARHRTAPRAPSGFSADTELSVRSSRGIDGTARAKSLQLLAGVDTQEFGPGYHDLLKFIAEAGAAH
jgi:hypothetical protein